MTNRSDYPSTYDVLYRKSAVARRMAFQNLNFVAETRQHLLRGEIEVEKITEAKCLIRGALQMARRNGESAKFTGCALYRF